MVQLAAASLTQGPISGHLTRMTIPMIWGILAVVAIQLTDMYFISLLGTDALSAISFTFPVTMLIFHVVMGFGIATSSILARRIGAGDDAGARRITVHAILLTVAVSLAMTVAGIALLPPVFGALGAPSSMMPVIAAYMVPWLMGSVFIAVPIVGNAAIRATGDTLTPAVIMVGAALLNLALNPVLIFGLFGLPRLEVAGSALATLISNAAAVAAGLYVLACRKKILSFDAQCGKGLRESVPAILMIAVPVGLTQMVMPVISGVVTAILAQSGPGYVAAFGIVQRLEVFAFVVIMALAIGMGPIIGQNWGAGDKARVTQTIDAAMRFAAWWSAAAAIVFALAGAFLVGLFTDDAGVRDVAVYYLLLVPAAYVAGNLANGWGSFYNAIGQPKWSFAIIVIRGFALTLPFVFAGHALAGWQGVFAGFALAAVLSGFGTHALSLRYLAGVSAGR